MSQTRPFRQDVNWIKGDTLQYQFTFNEDDSALDLSGKDEITVILRNRNSTIFTHTLTGGEITISGAGNNIISGEASSTVMDIASRSYDLIIFFDNDIKQTWVMFDVTIFDENSELNSSASEWTIDIDTTSGMVEGQATQQITAPTFSFSQDSVPDTLIEGAFAVVNGVTYVGNSDNEPVPTKGYKEFSTTLIFTAADISSQFVLINDFGGNISFARSSVGFYNTDEIPSLEGVAFPYTKINYLTAPVIGFDATETPLIIYPSITIYQTSGQGRRLSLLIKDKDNNNIDPEIIGSEEVVLSINVKINA